MPENVWLQTKEVAQDSTYQIETSKSCKNKNADISETDEGNCGIKIRWHIGIESVTLQELTYYNPEIFVRMTDEQSCNIAPNIWERMLYNLLTYEEVFHTPKYMILRISLTEYVRILFEGELK